MKAKLFGVAFAAALASCSAASAATVVQKFTFTAMNFNAYFGPLPAPVDPVTGSFVITYDPDVDQGPTTVGVQVVSLNIPNPGTGFVYKIVGDGVLDIGTKPNAVGGFSIQQIGDYGLSIFNVRTNPRMGYFQYFADNGGNYYAFDGELTLTGVPEPQSWALLLAGFGLSGGGIRLARSRARRLET
jgi:polyisoprenoid-binding protein YceI